MTGSVLLSTRFRWPARLTRNLRSSCGVSMAWSFPAFGQAAEDLGVRLIRRAFTRDASSLENLAALVEAQGA
jgi:hypothetical protein